MFGLIGAVATGLTKTCPRCGRNGNVFVESGEHPMRFLIVWEGPARGIQRPHDFDSVSVEELANPDFGCGYDHQIRCRHDGTFDGSMSEKE